MAELALLNSMIQRIGEKLPVYSGSSPRSFESDAVVRQNATALIEMSLFQPKETLKGLVGLLEDVSRPTLVSSEIHDPDNRYLNSQYVILKLINECLYLHAKHWQPETAKRFQISEQVGFLQSAAPKNRERSVEPSSCELEGNDNSGHLQAVTLDDSVLKSIFIVCSRLLVTTSTSINPDMLVHSYGDPLLLSTNSTDILSDCHKLVGQVVYFVSAVNWNLVFQRVKARLQYLSQGVVTQDVGLAGKQQANSAVGSGATGVLSAAGQQAPASAAATSSSTTGNQNVSQADRVTGIPVSASSDDNILFPESLGGANSGSVATFGDLTEIRLIEYIHLNDVQLKMLLLEIAHTVKNMKRAAQTQLAISLRPAIWNWIKFYPAQFSQLCAERRRLDASAELLFEFFNGLGDNFRRKQIFWPTQTMLLATCQDVVSDYVTNAEIRSARGVTALATISGTSFQNKRAQFLTDLRKNLKNSKLSDIALICMLEFVKVSTYSLSAENSAMKAWVASIEAELKERMLEAGRQANLSSASGKSDSENQFDPRLLADFFSCSWKLNPTSFIRFLVPLIVSENAPVIFQKALAKGCLSALGSSNSGGGVVTLDARLASFLRQLFLENRERVLAEPSSHKRNLTIVRNLSAQGFANGGSASISALLNANNGGNPQTAPAGGGNSGSRLPNHLATAGSAPGIVSMGDLSGRLSSLSLGNANSSISFAVYIHPNKLWQLSAEEIAERTDVARYILALWLQVPSLVVERESFGLLSVDHLKLMLSHLVLCLFEVNHEVRSNSGEIIRQLFHPSFLNVWCSLESAAANGGAYTSNSHLASTSNSNVASNEKIQSSSSVFRLVETDENVRNSLKTVWELSNYIILSVARGLLKLDVSFFPGNTTSSSAAGVSMSGSSGSSGAGSVFSSTIAYQQYNEFVKQTVNLVKDLVNSRNHYLRSCGKSVNFLKHVADRKPFAIFAEACTLIQICSTDQDTTTSALQCLQAIMEECSLLGDVIPDSSIPTSFNNSTANTQYRNHSNNRNIIGDSATDKIAAFNQSGDPEADVGHASFLKDSLSNPVEQTCHNQDTLTLHDASTMLPSGPILEFSHGKELSGSTLSSLSPTLGSGDSVDTVSGVPGEPLSFLENYHVYSNLVSSFQSAKNVVTGQKAQQKNMRRLLREVYKFSPGLSLGWIELHRRWSQCVYWILKPELYREMVLKTFGDDLILAAAEREPSKKRNFATSISKSAASQLLEKAVQQVNVDSFEDKGEWQNYAGILCVLAGVMNDGLKQVLGTASSPTAGGSLGVTSGQTNSAGVGSSQPINANFNSNYVGVGSNAGVGSSTGAHVSNPAAGKESFASMSHPSNFSGVLNLSSGPFNSANAGALTSIQTFSNPGAGGVGGNHVLLNSNGSPLANIVDLAISANQADVQLLYTYARNKLETFVMDLVDLAMSENVVVREAMKEILGNELCPNLLNLLLSCIHINVMNMCDPGGEAIISPRHTMIIDHLISIVKLVLDRAHKCSDHLLSTDLGSLIQGFVKYAARVPESAGGVQMRVRVRLCQLVELLIQQRDYVPVRQDVKLRNFIVQTFMEWTNVFNIVSEEAVAEDIALNKSGTGGGREITLAVLRCLVIVTHKMPLYVADSDRGPIMDTLETRTKLFVKIFSFHMKLLRVCQILESRSINDGSVNFKEATAFAAHVREFSILVLSNVISANVDVGIKYSLGMGYSEDTMTKAAFMQIFKNLLNQDTEFEGLNDGSKELLQAKYEKMIDLLTEPGLELVLALLETAHNQQSVDDLVVTLFNIFSGRNMVSDLLKAVVQREVQKTDSPATLFRRNSAATKLLTVFARTYGLDFLRQTLKVPLQFLIEYSKGTSFEVDPARLPADANLKSNTCALALATQTFIDTIVASASKFPFQLKDICHCISVSVAEKYPSSSTLAVGGFIILRFFNPAITSPDHFSLLSNSSINSRDMRRALVLISKIIQNLANNVLFGAKEPFMVSLNSIVTSNRDRIADFLNSLSALPDESKSSAAGSAAADATNKSGSGGHDAAQSVEQLDCIKMHRYLKNSMDAIERLSLTQRRNFGGHNMLPSSEAKPSAGLSIANNIMHHDSSKAGSLSSQTASINGVGNVSSTGIAAANSLVGNAKSDNSERNIADAITSSAEDIPRRSVVSRMNSLLQQMGPPLDMPLDLSSGKSNTAASAERSGQLYREFMERFRNRNLDEFVGRQILYEGAGLSKQRRPVLYFIASRVQRQYFDSELLLYFVLKVLETLANKQFDFVMDLTGFAAENDFGSDWYTQLIKLLPSEVLSLLDTLYVLNPSQYARAFAKKQQRVIPPGFSSHVRKLVFASSVSELHEYIALNDLQLPKATLSLDKDIVTFAPVTRLSAMHTRIPVILKINGDHLQCTTVKKQDLCGHQVVLNDVVEVADMEDVHLTSRHDEFVVKHAGGRAIMTFSSPKRDVIVKNLRAAKARQQFSDKPQLAVERVLHPNDVPGTLLNIALLNLSSSDAILRITAYELLHALCLFFSFDTGKMVLYANGLCIPANVTVFACDLSMWLAQAEPQLTLEFLTEFLVGFIRSNTQTQQFALEYLAPWLPHLFPYLRLIHATHGIRVRKSNSQTPSQSQVTGFPDKPYPSSQAPNASSGGAYQAQHVGQTLGQNSGAMSTGSAASGAKDGGGGVSNVIMTGSSLNAANQHDVEMDGRSLAKAEHIMRGFVDITVRTFTKLSTLLQSKLWSVLAEGTTDTIPYIVDLFVSKLVEMGVENPQSEALFYMMVALAHKNRQLVAGRIITRLRLAITGTASVPSHSPVQHPAWKEISALVRFTLVMSFNNLINVVEYMPDIVYVVTELAGVGSPLIRHSIHGTVINICQHFCSMMSPDDPKFGALRGLLAELSEPKYCFVFGLVTRTAGTGVAGNSAMTLGANAFVNYRQDFGSTNPGLFPFSYTGNSSPYNETLGGAIHAGGNHSSASGLTASTGNAGSTSGSASPTNGAFNIISSSSIINLGTVNSRDAPQGAASKQTAADAMGLSPGSLASTGAPSNLAPTLAGSSGSANMLPSSAGNLNSSMGNLMGSSHSENYGPSNSSGMNSTAANSASVNATSSGHHTTSVNANSLGPSGHVNISAHSAGYASGTQAGASSVAGSSFAGSTSISATSLSIPDNFFYNASSSADIVLNIPLTAAESIISFLMEMMTHAAPSESKLITWKARWMSFVVTTAFQFNPAVQPRAFIALGTLAQNEVDDGLIEKILTTLRGVLLIFSPEDDCRLLISIVRCLCFTVGNLSTESKYFKSMFWLAISLLQIGHAPVFQSALALLHVVLKLLDERGVFAKEDPRMYLIKARSQIADVAYQLDAAVGIHFRSHFSFALAANLMKGLKHPTTKTQTISVLMTLLEVSSKAGTGKATTSGSGEPSLSLPAGKLQRKPSQRLGLNSFSSPLSRPFSDTGFAAGGSPTNSDGGKSPDRKSANSSHILPTATPGAAKTNSVSLGTACDDQSGTATPVSTTIPSGFMPTAARVTTDVVGYIVPLLPFVEKFQELFWLAGVNIDISANSGNNLNAIGGAKETSLHARDKDKVHLRGSLTKSTDPSGPKAEDMYGNAERSGSEHQQKQKFGILPPGGILSKMSLTEESAILTLSFIVTMLPNAENEKELLVLYSLLAEAIVVIPTAFAIVAQSLIPILMKALSTNQTPEVVKAIEPILIGVATCRHSSPDHAVFDSTTFLGEIGFPGLSSCGTFKNITKEKKVTFAQCACAVVERVL